MIGRVTTSFLNSKDKFFVQVLSEEHTKGILAQSPVGTFILRVNVCETGRSTLIVSYKYANLIFCRKVPSITMKVTRTGSIYKCRTNPKNYKFLRKLATDYLPRLQLFINMFVNNHNFIERDLESANEIESELSYRKFLIFPQGDKVVLKRKVDDGIHTARIGFDFEEMSFFAEHDGVVTNVEAFNEFLITDFLKINFRDKLQVQYALGHQSRGFDLYASDADNLDQLDLRTNVDLPEETTAANNLKRKDKDKIIEKLSQYVTTTQPDSSSSGINDIRHLLVTVLESVSTVRDVTEQMDWINRGILDSIFTILLRNDGNTAHSITPIKIVKLLLRGNAEGCKILVKRYITAFDSNYEWTCIDLYTSICVLMTLPSFREAFLQNLGIPRLTEVYTKASYLLLRELKQNVEKVGEICPPSETAGSPRSELFSDADEHFSAEETDSEEYDEDEYGSSKEPVAVELISGPKHMSIPKLNIPMEKENRKLDKTEVEFQRTASEELMTLAQNLGETYMTQDLTALLSFLQNDTGVKRRKKERVSVSITADSFDQNLKHFPIHSENKGIQNSRYYKIKCAILKAFARLTVYWEYFDIIANPVNLLFSELFHCHKGNLITDDIEFRKLIYGVLANYANHVEHIHCYRFQELTREFSLARAKSFRQKTDKFIWRIYNQLVPSVEIKDIESITIYLTLLAEYIRYCPTGIVSMQVSAVCMESLLKVKEIATARGRVTPSNIDHIHLIHCVIDVFDQIALHCAFGQLREVLLSLLVEKKESWRFIKHYSCQILLNKALHKAIVVSTTNKQQNKVLVAKYKSQVIMHYQVCYQMIQKQIKFYIEEEKKQLPYAAEARHTIEQTLYDFEFLIDPNRGYILQILSNLKGTTNEVEYQKDVLRFLIEIFSAPNCVFLNDHAYIDAYLSYAYLSFIKLYHSLYTDEDTLELIQLHLELLLAFARNKNDKIIMKFYQLRVMDFLVREINLEYEITQRNKVKHPMETIQSSPPPPPAEEQKTTAEPIPLTEPKKSPPATQTPSTLGTNKAPIPPKSPEPQHDERKRGHTQPKRLFRPFKKKEGSLKKPDFHTSGDRILASAKEITKEQAVALPGKGNPKSGSYVITSLTEIGNTSNLAPTPTPAPAPTPVVNSAIADAIDAASLKGGKQKFNSLSMRQKNSKSQFRSQSLSKGTAKMIIPGLTLDSSVTTDGVARVGKSTSVKKDEEEISEEDETEEETEEGTEESEYETESEESEYETDTESEEEVQPKKPAIPSLSGVVPLKCDTPPPNRKKTIEKKKGGGIPGLSLTGDMIKGGSDSSVPKLSLGADMIKGGSVHSKTTDTFKEDEKMGSLSILESKIDKNDPKWQLIFENKKKEETEAQEDEELSQTDIQEINKLYRKECKERKIYASQKVHITALQLIFSLLLTPCDTLERLYSDQFPLDNKKLNIPFLLAAHLNHSGNALLIPPLVEETQKMGRAVFRLLKLLSIQLFRKQDYNDLKRLAIGAYGTVYRCRLKPDYQATSVAIKLMEVPKTIHDRCVLHDIFDEILVLDKFKDDNRISHAYDFGRDEDYYWITMKKYKCSLKHWRNAQKAPLQQNLALYLNIYMNILNAFQFLTENHVNHFDVKCDNFLIQPLNEESWTPQDEANFWNPISDVPNFYVCLADFGEAKVYDKEIDGYTTRNRGTEFTKSPEMLVVAYASQKTRATYDRRKKVGASSPSDVWSLGCLLYELLTGEFLFYDQDWVRFFIRVTSQGQELLTPEKIEKIDNNDILVEFLRFVLNRDPLRRPSIQDVIQRFKYVRGQLTSKVGAPSLRFPTPRDKTRDISNENTGNNTAEGSTISQSPEQSNDENQEEDKEQQPTLAHSISKETLIPKASRDEKAKFNRLGTEHFLAHVSKITEYLYLGPIEEVCKRTALKQLRITHMINCSKADSLYSTEFFTLKIPMTKENPEPLASSISSIVSFIKEARNHNGRVLVYSGDATSRGPAVVIAYLMVTRNWSYFESMIFVKDCRYIIDIDDSLVKILCEYHRQSQRSLRKQYQCLCGACAITVTEPFNQSYFLNPFPCSCGVDDEPTNCPNIGCAEYISEMKRLFQYTEKEVMWGYTNRSSIIGDLSKSTREYIQSRELCVTNPTSKSWAVYKCCSCDFITHALRKTGPNEVVNSHFDVAVVTSIAVSRSESS